MKISCCVNQEIYFLAFCNSKIKNNNKNMINCVKRFFVYFTAPDQFNIRLYMSFRRLLLPQYRWDNVDFGKIEEVF